MPFHTAKQRRGFFAQITGLKGKLERAQEKRILSKTKEEEIKLGKTEKKLSKRLKFETKKAKRLERVSKERLALEKVKSRERATQREIEKFTPVGKAKRFIAKEAKLARRGAVVTGKFVGKQARIGAERFAEERRERKAFLRTPEGRRQVREAGQRRAKFFKRIGKVKLV